MKNRILINLLRTCLIGFILYFTGCIFEYYEDYRYQVPKQTGDGLEVASLSEVGMNQTILEKMMHYLLGLPSNKTHAILVVKNGKLVFEEYFAGYTFGSGEPRWEGSWINYEWNTRHWTGSATKSFTSAIVGIAIDKGLIPSVNEKIYLYFPEYQHLFNDRWKQVTIRHLLTNTTGYQWNENEVSYDQESNDLIRFNRSTEPWAYIFTKPMIHKPGNTFYYASTNTILAGEIIKRATGLNADRFSAPALFQPLGISDYAWQYLRPDLVFTSGDMMIRPRDMAKFGLLFLKNGNWKGRRIISRSWVIESTTEVVDIKRGMHNSAAADGYAYAWWNKTFSVDGEAVYSFSAQGWGGQMIYVFPDHDVVVVFTGGYWMTFPACDSLLQDRIIPAFLN